jgi:hypothetical protein
MSGRQRGGIPRWRINGTYGSAAERRVRSAAESESFAEENESLTNQRCSTFAIGRSGVPASPVFTVRVQNVTSISPRARRGPEHGALAKKRRLSSSRPHYCPTSDRVDPVSTSVGLLPSFSDLPLSAPKGKRWIENCLGSASNDTDDITGARVAIEVHSISVPMIIEVTSLGRAGCEIGIEQADALTAGIANARIDDPL